MKYLQIYNRLLLPLLILIVNTAAASAMQMPYLSSAVTVTGSNAALETGAGLTPNSPFTSGSTLQYEGTYSVNADLAGTNIVAIDVNGYTPGTFTVTDSLSIGSIIDSSWRGNSLPISIASGQNLTLTGTGTGFIDVNINGNNFLWRVTESRPYVQSQLQGQITVPLTITGATPSGVNVTGPATAVLTNNGNGTLTGTLTATLTGAGGVTETLNGTITIPPTSGGSSDTVSGTFPGSWFVLNDTTFLASNDTYSALGNVDFQSDKGQLTVQAADSNSITLSNTFLNASNATLVVNTSLIVTDPSAGNISDIQIGQANAPTTLTFSTTGNTSFNSYVTFANSSSTLVFDSSNNTQSLGGWQMGFTSLPNTNLPLMVTSNGATMAYTMNNQIVGNQDGAGIVQLSAVTNPLAILPNSFTNNTSSFGNAQGVGRLQELQFTGSQETDIYVPVYTQTLTFGQAQSAGIVGPVVFAGSASGINTINLNQSALVYDIPNLAIKKATIINDNATVDLNANTLKFASGNLLFEGNTTFNTAFNSTLNPNTGGNIVVNYDSSGVTLTQTQNAEGYFNDKIFYPTFAALTFAPDLTSGVSSINVNLTANSTLPSTATPPLVGVGLPDNAIYSYYLIQAVNDDPTNPLSNITPLGEIIDGVFTPGTGSVLPSGGSETLYFLFFNTDTGAQQQQPIQISFTANESNITVEWHYATSQYLLYATFNPQAIIPYVSPGSPAAVSVVQELVTSAASGNAQAAQIVNNLGQLQQQQLIAAAERLVPTETASIATGEATDLAFKGVADRMDDLNLGVDVDSRDINAIGTGYTSLGVAAGDDDRDKYGLWINPFYQRASQRAYSQVRGYRMTNTGFTIGGDTLVGDNATLGIAWTYVEGKIRHQDTKVGDKAHTHTNIFDIYGFYNLPKDYFVSGTVGYGVSHIKNRESRTLTTTVTENATAKYNSQIMNAKIMTGKTFHYGEVNLVPQLGLRYYQSNDDAYNETGASIQNLSVGKKSSHTTELVVGARITGNYPVNSWNILPQFSGFSYITLNDSPSTTQIGSDAFTGPVFLPETKSSKAWYSLSAGVNFVKNHNEYGLLYECQLDKKYVSNQGLLRLRMNF